MQVYPKLSKKIKKNSTYKFKLTRITPKFEDQFVQAQIDYKIIYNLTLKYLYQHFGVRNLDVYLPMLGHKRYPGVKNMGFYYFIKRILHNVIKKAGKEVIFDRQAVDLFVESIVRNFNEYRKKQRKVKYWSKKNKERYLKEHNCSLSGFGRLKYQHDYDHFKTVSLKQNGTKAIYLVDKHHIKIPYFGKIYIKQSLNGFKDKKIIEAQIEQRPCGDYILHVTVQRKIARTTTKEQFNQANGGDINSANDEFFTFDDGFTIKWDPQVKAKYKEWDKISRQAQNYIDKHQYDDNLKLKQTKQIKQKTEAKKKNLMLNWYREAVAPTIASHYPMLVMERLHTMGLRINKYKNNKISKKKKQNINNKLNNVIRPTTFLNVLIDTYQALGQTLILVDPTDTSKTCHYCNNVNHNLGFEKVWVCPNCQRTIKRDANACLNIRDWGKNPDKHILAIADNLKEYPWVNKNDLITIY